MNRKQNSILHSKKKLQCKMSESVTASRPDDSSRAPSLMPNGGSHTRTKDEVIKENNSNPYSHQSWHSTQETIVQSQNSNPDNKSRRAAPALIPEDGLKLFVPVFSQTPIRRSPRLSKPLNTPQGTCTGAIAIQAALNPDIRTSDLNTVPSSEYDFPIESMDTGSKFGQQNIKNRINYSFTENSKKRRGYAKQISKPSYFSDDVEDIIQSPLHPRKRPQTDVVNQSISNEVAASQAAKRQKPPFVESLHKKPDTTVTHGMLDKNRPYAYRDMKNSISINDSLEIFEHGSKEISQSTNIDKLGSKLPNSPAASEVGR